MSQLPAYDLNRVRQAFPIAQHLTYLNHASISPLPQPTQAAIETAAARLAEDPMAFFGGAPGDELGNILEVFLNEIAGLIHAEHMHEVVGVQSTSTAMNTIAQSINWRPGDNIVLARDEFPSNVYPWLVLERHGVECRFAEPDQGGASPEAFAPLVDDHTRLIAVSAIQFLSGHRADLMALGAFCRERGIIFAVDAIQAAGHIPLDVQTMHIDILAAGGQKSLMGPPGQGFLYVRDALCETLQPSLVGPNATEDWEHWIKYDLTPRQGAFRFMMGTLNLPGMAGLVASVRFLCGLGMANIDAWTQHLSQIAIEDLSARGWAIITPTDPAHLGPIVTFRVGDPDNLPAAETRAVALHKHLTAEGIRVTKHWNACDVPHLRISTHCYNTGDEVRRVGATLEEYHE